MTMPPSRAKHILVNKVMAGEVIRYAITGCLSAGLNVAIVVGLTEWAHFHYLVSTTFCFMIVTGVSFWLNRRWTFGKQGGNAAADLTRYVSALLANLLVSLVLSYALVEYCSIPYALATVILSAIFAPVSFLIHRQWSFALRWPIR